MSLLERHDGLAASFAHLDSLLEAVQRVRREGPPDLASLEAFSPVPSHELEHLVHPRRPLVRYFTLFGGTFGLCFGFGLAIGTSYIWELIVSGKPITSIPAYVVVGFEMTILFGALLNLFAVLWLGGLPRLRHPAYDPRFSRDRFGLFVRLAPPRMEQEQELEALRDLLRACRAEQIWRIANDVRTEITPEPRSPAPAAPGDAGAGRA